jgi:hypothetical protein
MLIIINLNKIIKNNYYKKWVLKIFGNEKQNISD